MSNIRIEVRNDKVIIDGYVNAVDRYSNPIPSERGNFIEKIKPKAFQRALEKAENIDLMLNHERKLGSTTEGNLKLFEDNIGLRAIAEITDTKIIEKAKNKQLRGWSFGFYSEKDTWKEDEGVQKRIIEELDLFEVTIVDDTKNPAYIGTSIETRENKEVLKENRSIENEIITIDETTKEKKEDERTLEVFEKEIEILKLKAHK